MKTKWFRNLGIALCTLIAVIGLMGCTPPKEGNTNSSAPVEQEMTLAYTAAFGVEYLEDGIKKITDADNRTIIVVPEGKKAPDGYKDAVILQEPLENVMLASTTQGCMLRALDEIDSIVAVTTPQESWTITEIADAMGAGKITFVGDSNTPDYEKIKAINPSLVFVYSGKYGLQDMITKFDELGINYAICNEYLEDDPRGRMEWLKFYSTFYDKETEADAFFETAIKNLDATVKKAENSEKPKVAWGNVRDGKVFVASQDSFVGKIIEMAGGDYVFKDATVGSGSSGITLEEFYATAKDADIMIYSSLEQYAPTLESVLNEAPVLENMKAVKDGKVWCLDNNHYQTLDETDKMIEDLFNVFHGDESIGYFVKY